MNSEKQKELREETRARAFRVRDQISIVLENQGIKVEISDRRYGLGACIENLDGVYVNLEIKPQYSHIGYGTAATGKLHLSFGKYGRGRRKSYPEPKAGYNVNRICDVLKEWLTREKELDEKEQKRKEELDWIKAKVKELEPKLDRLGLSAEVKWNSNIEISRLFSSPYELELFLQGIEKGNFTT